MLEYKLNLAGCECSVIQWNSKAKLTALALHGWLDNLASFHSLAEAMPDIRLIAVDFPGHGHSAHLPQGLTYNFIDGLYVIDDLIRHLQLPKVNIIGHSMGGSIACLYTAAQKENVEKLVLIDSLGPLTTEPESCIKQMVSAITQRADKLFVKKVQLSQQNCQNILEPSPAENKPSKRFSPIYKDFEKLLSARAKVSDIKPELIEPIVKRSLIKKEDGYTWCSDSRLKLASAIRLSEAQLLQILPKVEADVLLLEAKNGYLKDNKLMQLRKQYFQKLEVQTLTGGHHVHLEETQKCADKIVNFLTH